MSKADLQTQYQAVTSKEPDKTLTKEQLVDAIGEIYHPGGGFAKAILGDTLPETEGPTFYGNKDTDKAHKLPKDWKGAVVVEQWGVELNNGGMIEVPNTRIKQTYSKDMFERMLDDSKGQKNFFADSGLKYQVLHMPE